MPLVFATLKPPPPGIVRSKVVKRPAEPRTTFDILALPLALMISEPLPTKPHLNGFFPPPNHEGAVLPSKSTQAKSVVGHPCGHSGTWLSVPGIVVNPRLYRTRFLNIGNPS